MNTNEPEVIVVGAGVGGMTAAIHLAQRGFDVTIVEKNSHVGGRCSKIEHRGYRFDTGPTLFVMHDLYREELRRIGLSAHEDLNLVRVDPGYHLYFEDGSRLQLTSDLDSLSAQVEAIEPGAATGLQAYLAEAARHYELGIANIVQRDFLRPTDFFNPHMLKVVVQLKALVPHYRHTRRFFDDPRLRAAFTFQDLYMGLSPFQAAATYSFMPYSELRHGVWYPRGGMQNVATALEKQARRAGVQILTNAPVERIAVSDHHADGVVLQDGRKLTGDYIVANADLPYVYDKLLPAEPIAERLMDKRFSCSTISFFWGLDRSFDELKPHMLFLADDYRGGFEALHGSTLPAWPSLYVHCPSKIDPSAAPEGRDALIGIVPVGNDLHRPGDNWRHVRDAARNAIYDHLEAVGLAGLSDHIEFEISMTPRSWAKRYNLVHGATHGLSHHLSQMGYLRPHNHHNRYRNLFFAGASTHPGTGLPTVMVSGRLAADRILQMEMMAGEPSPLPH
jgi:phytoene desaturase